MLDTGPLITVIKRKKNIFLSRRCVRRLPGIILPFWEPFSLVLNNLSGAWAGDYPAGVVGTEAGLQPSRYRML